MQTTALYGPSVQPTILKEMQPQPTQNMYVQPAVASNSNQVRTTQTGSLYRGPSVSPAPRSGARHVPMQALYPQALHQGVQSVVVQSFPQYQRQAFQAPPYAQYTQPMQANYPYPYPSYYPVTAQRTGVSVSAGVGNTLSVQPNPSSPMPGQPGSTQAQIPLAPSAVLAAGSVPPSSNPTVLSVAPSPNGQQVTVQSMVGVVQTAMPTQPSQKSIRRRTRAHALEIIDPNTNKNILEDFDTLKTSTNSDIEYPEQNMFIQQPIVIPEQVRNVSYDMIDVHQPIGQTPVVSAITDGPSVEILPPTQKPRNKKILPIVNPNDDNSVHSAGIRTNDNQNSRPLQHHQQSAVKIVDEEARITKTECVQQQLPASQSQQNDQLLESALTNLVAFNESNISIERGSVDSIHQQQTLCCPKLKSVNKPQTKIARSTTSRDSIQNKDIFHKSGIVDLPNVLSINGSTTLTLPIQEKQQQQDLTNEIEILSYAPTPTDIVNSTTDLAKAQIQATDSESHTMQLIDLISKEVKRDICHVEDSKEEKETLIGSNESAGSNGVAIVEDAESSATLTDVIKHEKNVIDLPKDSHIGHNISKNSIGSTKQNQQDHLNATKTDVDCGKMELISEPSEISTQKSSKISTLLSTQMEILDNSNGGTENKININADVLHMDLKNYNNCTTYTTGTTPTMGGYEPTFLQQSLISYNEGQWSPCNLTGKKQYDREQLLQLRESKASRRQPDVNNVSILPTPNLMPSFVRNPKRAQSVIGSISSNRGAAGSISGGDLCGNYSNKQASMPGVHGRGSTKGMIRVNLSLNQDVKLNETDNAWRPRALDKSDDVENSPEAKSKREKEELIRRVRGILNKLTPEKFDALVEEIIKLKIDTPDKMEDVMVLVFEKAIDEPNFSVSYARLCHRLITEVKARDERMESGTKSNLAQFRAALLDKTEREFTQNVTKSKAKEKKLQPIIEKIANCTEQTEKAELEAQLEEEERKIRRRSGGTVRFIGELFKISMLTGKIINSCIEALLNPNSEDQLECLCKLLATVGAKFEQTPINMKESSRCYSLEKTISRMQSIASKTEKEGTKVSSRVRFMLQDVIDLRRDKWQSKRNESPKTMGQVEKEMKTEQLSSQYLNYAGTPSAGGSSGSTGSASFGPGGKRDERIGGGRYNDSRTGFGGSISQRGDPSSLRRQQQSGGNNNNNSGHSNPNNDDNTWIVQTSKGSRSLDTNKLEGMSTANNFEAKKMGGLSQFIWSHGSRQTSSHTSTPTNSFAALSALSESSRSNERDGERDRDRSGPRNKGSFHKGSMERDRFGLNPRLSNSQVSRENSSSRGPQTSRTAVSASSAQKSTNTSKFVQQQMPLLNRMTTRVQHSAGSSLYPQNVTDEHSCAKQQGDNKDVRKSTEPLTAVFEKFTDGDATVIKSVVSEMVEVASNPKSFKSSLEPCILRIKETQRSALLFYIMTDYLHLRHVGKLQRRYLGNIVAYLFDTKFISREHFLLAYNEFCDIATDLALDIPDLWKYIIEFIGPLIKKKIITLHDLWSKKLKEDNGPSFGKKFLKIFLDYSLSEIGPSFTRNMWKKSNIKFSDFMDESENNSFIQTNKLQYIEDETMQPNILNNESKEDNVYRVSESVETLLKEETTADFVIDFINGNIREIDKHFIRNLATRLCDSAITYKDNSYKLEIECFQKICIPVLHRYIDSKEEFELECLYAMQLLVAKLEHPRGLLSDLFGELYDADVIPQDSFVKWRDSKDQSAGKGVAVKGLNPFFNHVLSSETSDENN